MLEQLYENFRHWSNGGSVWIYSDTHFDDDDCQYMSRFWPPPEEQIKIINSKVYKNDTLILLGDIGNPKYLTQIKANYKVLIAGNHDLGLNNYRAYFNELYDGPLFISDKILLSHEPIDLPFVFNIHGHTHGASGYWNDANQFNVCSNCVNFEPQNLGNIIKQGYLKNIKNIHRFTIDNIENKG